MLTESQVDFLISQAGRDAMKIALPSDALQAITKLRKKYSPQQASAIVELHKVRSKAKSKFPPSVACQIFASDVMFQQSSSLRLANYVASQLTENIDADTEIFDVCSGLGTDAIAANLAGAKVKAIDLNPAVAKCATQNSKLLGARSIEFIVGSAEQFLPQLDGKIVHCDPDRRSTGRRSASLEDYAPSLETLKAIIEKSRAGAIKFSPATDISLLSDFPGAKIEFISEDWTCKQLVLWWGDIAYKMPDQFASVITGDFESPICFKVSKTHEKLEVTSIKRWLYEIDPAVIAARATDSLGAQVDATRIDSQLDWLTGENKIVDCPAIRSFEVLKILPGRINAVKSALAKLDAGQVAIKPRGIQLNTDSLQKKLRKVGGENRLVVFWGKFGKTQQAIITRDNEK